MVRRASGVGRALCLTARHEGVGQSLRTSGARRQPEGAAHVPVAGRARGTEQVPCYHFVMRLMTDESTVCDHPSPVMLPAAYSDEHEFNKHVISR